MRLLRRLALALLLLAALALGGLWWRLDALAERVIERSATERLGVATEIDRQLLRPISGILSLRGLTIANPPGYGGPFLAVERTRADLDVTTLRREMIEIREIALDGVELALEQTRLGSNFDAIVAKLGQGAPASQGGRSRAR